MSQPSSKPGAKRLRIVSNRRQKKSSLTPELREFIDRAIVPALVKQALAEIDLAESESDAAKSLRRTAALKLRTVRP